MLSFYESKKVFQAVCANPLHGRCVLTRVVPGSGVLASSSSQSSRRRPVLGLMAAWLNNNHQATKEGHWSADALAPSLESRRAARLLLHMTEGGEELFSFEGSRGGRLRLRA